jgi:hypothetical protein
MVRRQGYVATDQMTQDELTTMLAEYQVLASLYTTTRQITHTRFTAFCAIEGALLVGLFVLTTKAYLLTVCSCALGLTLFFLLSTHRDYEYVYVRATRGEQIESLLRTNIGQDVAKDDDDKDDDGSNTFPFTFTRANKRMGVKGGNWAWWEHMMDFALPISLTVFWIVMIILLEKDVIRARSK